MRPPASPRRSPPRLGALSALALSSVAASGVALAVACTSTDQITVGTVGSGIILSATQITAGHGCGTGDDQVFKYRATLTASADGGPVEGASLGAPTEYDCFADARFFPTGGTPPPTSYTIAIEAYDERAYAAMRADASAAGPTWTTECTATALGVLVSATCAPLTPTGNPLPPLPEAGADGGEDAAASIDGGADGGDAGAADGGEAGAADASDGSADASDAG